MNTITRPRIHHYHWLDWLLRPIYRFLDRWDETHREAKNFTTATCPKCAEPAARPNATFCSRCGANLDTDKVPTVTLNKPSETIEKAARQLAGLKQYASVEDARRDMQTRTGRINALPQSVRPTHYTPQPARLMQKLAEKQGE